MIEERRNESIQMNSASNGKHIELKQKSGIVNISAQ